MYQRLIDAGQRIFYQPAARVHHGVPRNRQTRRYLLHRLFWDGASQSLLAFGAAQERGRPYHPWREAYRDLRHCGRCTFDMLGGLGRLRQHAAWDALLRLTQRLGRLRAHVEIGMERAQ